MKIDLSQKVAVVTGAASNGLGRAHALALGKAGAQIAIIDVLPATDTVQALQDAGIQAKGYVCDISNADDVRQTIDQIIEDFQHIHILINNASILTTVGFFADIPDKQWKRDVEVNLIGSANVSRAVWPHMMRQGWGRLIFISSIAGTRGGSGQTSYSSTKAGVIGLAKSLALEGAKSGITANAVAPGIMETEAAMKFIRDDMLERMKKAIPLRRFGKPEDVSSTVTFLASEQASYITGQVLTVDGGSGLFVF